MIHVRISRIHWAAFHVPKPGWGEAGDKQAALRADPGPGLRQRAPGGGARSGRINKKRPNENEIMKEKDTEMISSFLSLSIKTLFYFSLLLL